MRAIISSMIIMFALVSCGESVTFSDENLKSSYAEYQKNMNEETAKSFAGKVVEYLVNNPDGKELEAALEEGIKVSEKFGLDAAKSSFTTFMIKEYPGNPDTDKRIFQLAALMKTSGKTEAANALFYSLVEKSKNGKYSTQAKKEVDPAISDIDAYILKVGESVFENPDQFGLNRKNAQAYVDACEAYAMVNPESVATPDFLYRAAETAKTLKTFPKALSLYDWIITKYPDYEKAPSVLFLKGFVLDNDLGNAEEAKKTYEQFLKTYPRHQLSDDVQFLLENMGKSDDEIMEIISQRNKKNS